MPWAILVLGLLITWQAWLGQSRYNEVELHAEFEARVVDGANRVQLRMDSYQQVLRGVAGLLSAGAEVDRQQFRAYVQALGLAERFPGIQGVGASAEAPSPHARAAAAARALAKAQGRTQAEALAYYNLLKERMKVQVKVPAPKPDKGDEVAAR